MFLHNFAYLFIDFCIILLNFALNFPKQHRKNREMTVKTPENGGGGAKKKAEKRAKRAPKRPQKAVLTTPKRPRNDSKTMPK